MSTADSKASNKSKILRCIKVPTRILTKARDLYIQGMSECSGRLSHGGAVGCPTPQFYTLPKSFSVGSSKSGDDDDFRELVKAVSSRSLGNKTEMELLRRQQLRRHPTTAENGVSRSQSTGVVAFERIDEDMPCDFGDDDVKVKTDLYPRSRSCYAVTKRNGTI